MEAAGNCIPYGQCADKECTVAFAEWPVITPAVAMDLSQNAAKLGHCRQPNKQGNLYAAEGRDKGKRQNNVDTPANNAKSKPIKIETAQANRVT